MERKKFIRILGCFGVAVAITTGVVFWDNSVNTRNAHETSLQWARQVTAQVEGMAYTARGRGEADPIGWSVNYLSQGVEPRILQIAKFITPASGQMPDSYKLDLNKGSFEYVKILTPEDGTGVKITIRVDHVGFMGARSRLAGDFFKALFFAATFVVLFYLTGNFIHQVQEKRLRYHVLRWILEVKGLLSMTGVQLKNIVKDAQLLATASGKSRDTLGALREKIHAKITETHTLTHTFKDTEQTSGQAEALLLNLIIEANRLGDDGKRLAEMSQQLHRMIQKLRANSKNNEAALRQFELLIEPWAMDADIAFHAYNEIYNAAQGINGGIRKTTENMLNHAKLIQNLNTQMGTQDVPAVPPPFQKRESA